jgi:hypothetical protein
VVGDGGDVVGGTEDGGSVLVTLDVGGDVSWDVGVTGGGSLKITPGFALVVAVGAVVGGACVVPVDRVPAFVAVVVVVVVTEVVEDEEDVVGLATVDGGVEVVGTNRLVAVKPGWARAASPVGGFAPSREMAATSSPPTTTATTRPSRPLARASLL